MRSTPRPDDISKCSREQSLRITPAKRDQPTYTAGSGAKEKQQQIA